MAPKLPCRELTGADCDRPVALDAQDCGIAEHVVPPQPEKRAPGRESIPMGVRRPTLVVDEEFDLFDDLDDDLDDGEIPSIDASSLLVSATAQRSFTTRHQVLPEVAIDEIRFLAARAVEMDSIELLDTGRLKLSAKKFVLYLSPNGRTVVGYSTRHYERTLPRCSPASPRGSGPDATKSVAHVGLPSRSRSCATPSTRLRRGSAHWPPTSSLESLVSVPKRPRRPRYYARPMSTPSPTALGHQDKTVLATRSATWAENGSSPLTTGRSSCAYPWNLATPDAGRT